MANIARLFNRNVKGRSYSSCCPRLISNLRISAGLFRSYYTYNPDPFHPLQNREPKWVKTCTEAVSCIESGHHVFVHGTAATPLPLVEEMAHYGKRAGLKDVKVTHVHCEGKGTYTKPEFEGIFRNNSLFVGAFAREPINNGRADFVPIFLSEAPLLFRRNVYSIDVALMQISPPDDHGFCTLGPSIDTSRAAAQKAKKVVGVVNPKCPRTFGDGVMHISQFDVLVEDEFDIPEMKLHSLTPEEKKIGKLISENLVKDGATLQMGIGSIPDAVLSGLFEHKDLGIHSEMFSDRAVELVENGNITNARKKVQTGRIVSSFVIGSKKCFDFLNDNPFVVMLDLAFVNNVSVIRKNPNVTAINSCIEIDITGQVVADSIGDRIYSGFGGQVDFMRGAALGEDGLGKPIIALPSTTRKGQSKIAANITPGGGVVTTRAHVHYVVTENGIAYLFGKNLRQRAYELIKIAHPDHRENLEKAAYEKLKCMPSPD